MNCYYCDEKPGPGGMRIHDITAIGICHDCGVAVCRDHGQRPDSKGLLLRCRECVQTRELATGAQGRDSRRTA